MLYFSIVELHKCVPQHAVLYTYIYIYMRLIGPGISQVFSLPQQRQLTNSPLNCTLAHMLTRVGAFSLWLLLLDMLLTIQVFISLATPASFTL